MKLLSLTAVAAVLALLPAAHAQVTCNSVEVLMEHAWDDFLEISGEEIEDGIYDTDYWLPDADECVVHFDLAAMYACQWVFADEAAATSAYDSFAQAIEACLSDWGAEPEYGGDANGEMIPLRTLFLTGPGEFADLEWAVALDRHETADVRDFHVSVALAYW